MGGDGSGRRRMIRIEATAPITDIGRLVAIGKDRGYPSRARLCEYLAKETNYLKDPFFYQTKLSKMNFTYGDIIMISHALEMTAAEFVAVWFPHIFKVDEDGITRVHVPPDMLALIKERQWNNEQLSRKRNEIRKANKGRRQAESETEEFLKALK